MPQVINWLAAINQVRERVISLWMQITKQHNCPNPKSFCRFPCHLQNFSFHSSNSIDSTYTQAAATRGTILLALATKTLLSYVTYRIVSVLHV